MGNNLRFSVPCNWKMDLLNEIEKNPLLMNTVSDFYGAKDKSFTGSGRPFFIMAHRQRKEMESFINKVHAMGKKFTWLWNGKCLGYKKFDPGEQANALDELNWLESIGIEYITIVDPYLAKFVRSHNPNIKVKVSLIAEVISISQALDWQEIIGGHGIINLSVMVNRNFPLLKEFKSKLNCDIQLLVNDSCVNECPFRFFHYSETSHSSQSHDVLEGFYNDYAVIACQHVKGHNPEQVMMAKWIQPSDLEQYQEIGIDYFKISGRRYETAWIINVLNAFAGKSYAGNLGDLLNGYNFQTDPLQLAGSQFSEYTEAQIKAGGYPDDEDLMIGIPEYGAKVMCNQLSTFMSKIPFGGARCIENCGITCTYCGGFVEKAYQLPSAEKAAAYRRYITYLSDYMNLGEMFVPKAERKTVSPVQGSSENSLYGIQWSQAALSFLDGIRAIMPESLQKSARKAIRHIAERTAEKKQAEQVSKELVIAILLQLVPVQFRHDLLDYLHENNIDTSRYLSEEELKAIQELPYGLNTERMERGDSSSVNNNEIQEGNMTENEWLTYLADLMKAYAGIPELSGIIPSIKPLVVQYRITDNPKMDFWQSFNTGYEWGTGSYQPEDLPMMIHKTDSKTIQQVCSGEQDPMQATISGLYSVEGATEKLMACIPLLPLFGKAHKKTI